MGVNGWARKAGKSKTPEARQETAEQLDPLADPFSDAFAAPEIPRISPTTSPGDRAALVAELRGLVRSGEYHVDAEVVAVAVMNASGQMIRSDKD